MKKRESLLVPILLFLLGMMAHAQMSAPSGPFEGFKSADDQPVEIKADYMDLEMATGNLKFKGHVKAKQGKRIIYADRVDVAYTEDGKITRLEAGGNVKVVMEEAFAVCGLLVLDNEKRTITLKEGPRMVQGRQIITGDKMEYDIATEKLLVSSPRIEWVPGEGTSLPGEEKPAGEEGGSK